MSKLVTTLDRKYYQIYDAARRGFTNREIADLVGVTPAQLAKWLKTDSELALMVETLRDLPARMVEDALFRKSLGYEYEEETILYKDGEEIDRKVTCKHNPPDVQAMKFFLKNRGKDWSDKVEVDTNQEVTIIFDPALQNV